MTLLVIVLFVVGFFVVVPIAQYLYERSPMRRRKFIARILASTHLQVDEETLASLDRYTARRFRWGAFGDEIGLVLTVPVAFALLYANTGPSTFVIVFLMTELGRAVGNAASGLPTTALADLEPRIASMRTHRPADYLPRREMVAEVVCGLAGVAVASASALALILGQPHRTAWVLALLLGAAVTGTTVTAMVLQRRLLHAPIQASSTSQLLAREVILALGLRDLFLAVLRTTALCAYGFLIWATSSLLLALLFVAFFVGIVGRIFRKQVEAAQLPVARRLVGAYAR